MIHPYSSLGRSSRWAFFSVLLVGSSTLAGCGNPGEGSVAVSSESRDRIMPHLRSKAKGVNAQANAGQPLSVKQRVRQKAASQSE